MTPETSRAQRTDTATVLMVAVAAGDGAMLRAVLGGVGQRSVPVLVLPLDAQAFSVAMAAGDALGLQVVPVADGAGLDPDRVQVLHAGTAFAVEHDRVRLRRAAGGESQAGAETLTACAGTLGGRAITVVLAGASQRLAVAALAVRESGGELIIQQAGAQTATDPRLADQVVGADRLIPRLQGILERRAGQPAAPPALSAEEQARIIGLAGQQTGVDFAQYKPSTLRRRILRRMGVLGLAESAAYLDLLRAGPAEAASLNREILISVTRFFRDPEAFAAVDAEVIRPLLQLPARKDPLRIWVAGCATGEEAYSIAILVREAMAAHMHLVPVKIFATDLDREAIDAASRGIYPASINDDVSAERLERFFTRHGDGYQIAKHVRELVVFAHHNLTADPPFFRMDLVTCRNLLIYLQPDLQRRVFSAFHFALAGDGCLLLGTSESLGDMATYFTPITPKWKLYRKRGERIAHMSDSLIPDPGRRGARPVLLPRDPGRVAADEILQDAIQRTLLDELGPAVVVADREFNVQFTSGAVARYLTLPRGKPSFNLIHLAPHELSVALSTGIIRVLREQKPVIYDHVALRSPDGAEGGALQVRVTIRPLPIRPDRGLVAVVFEGREGPVADPGQAFDLAVQSDQRITDLEAELDHSRESLQAVIEELETANEELQATNEELLAANEELQGTNEELQAVNEELYTANAENQAKIAELTELNDDILNLLGSSNIGTVFLDRRLCVRKFTQAATAQINLMDGDVGRPLAHFSNNIADADLVPDAEEVLRTLVPRQRKVRTVNGQWYLMRIIPYRTEEHKIKGVVISFIDIAEIILAGEEVLALAMSVEKSTASIALADAANRIVYVNHRFSDIIGWRADEAIGRDLRLAFGAAPDDPAHDGFDRAMAAGTLWTGRLRHDRRDGVTIVEDAVVIPLPGAGGAAGKRLKIGTVVAGATS